MCFDDELTAFQEYAKSLPNNCIFLVDTYDTIEGVKNAIKTGKKLKEQGHKMLGIRLDSGDLATLSKKARKLLDDAGFQDTAIVASNDLDEFRIKKLKENKAAITVWGVGTRLATAYDQPALGGVYKLAAIKREGQTEWDFKIKRSEQAIKTSNPGILEVKRFFNGDLPLGDQVVNSKQNNFSTTIINFKNAKVVNFGNSKAKNLLDPLFRKGKLVYKVPDIHTIRAFCLEQQLLFSNINMEQYPVGLEQDTHRLKMTLINKPKLSRLYSKEGI